MRKIKIIIGLLLLLAVAISNTVTGSVIPCPCDTVSTTPSNPVFDVRVELIRTAESKVGVAEATGNNDGADVLEFQKATGNKKGDQWCASFCAWVYKTNGLNTTGNAYSPSWFTKSTVIYKPSENIYLTPAPGDVFGIWVESKGRVGHVGIIYSWGDDMVTTIEGNYSNKVVKQKRIKRQIYVASNWVNNQSTI